MTSPEQSISSRGTGGRPAGGTIASTPLPEHARRHNESIRAFRNSAASRLTPAARSYRRLLAHCYNLIIPPAASVLEVGCGDGELLSRINSRVRAGTDLSDVQLARAREKMPDVELKCQPPEDLDLPGPFDFIIVSETINYFADVERLFARLHRVATPRTRLILNFHNNLWRPAFSVATWLGIRRKQPGSAWLSKNDIAGLLDLAGWEVITETPRILWPVNTPLLAPLFNRWIAPFLPWACITVFTTARPRVQSPADALSVSVVIPARNEAGNIEDAVRRTPGMGEWTELIFVEGGSTDATWTEIQRVQAAYPERRIKALRQSLNGKGNAVREGFAVAEGDVLMILDADLTMPPEELPKFYEAISGGRVEFANGSRLVYPMDTRAMQFLNMIANKLFGIAFSWLLGQRLKDTLCGTKVLLRDDYQKIAANRAYFGEFDPFGDFDLLFGAGKLNLKIADIPIRYKERTYGSTNIHRWSHGWLLLRMVLFAARKLKFV